MDSGNRTVQMATTAVSNGHEHTDDLPADIDEPPELYFAKLHSRPAPSSAYNRTMPSCVRRESLLTRQLHSETEPSDEEQIFLPVRALSTTSTWSNLSTASMAELTSDDGRSAPSPAISPPLPPTNLRGTIPATEKLATVTEPRILGLDAVVSKDPVEAGLGRKRCITFACGNKTVKPVEVQPVAPPSPKRKCALRFVCPTKPAQADATPIAKAPAMRLASPALKHRRSSSSIKSANSPASPRLLRKTPVALAVPEKSESTAIKRKPIRPAHDSDDSGAEATKFHEFASSEDEPDEWTQESTCYRNRLCVADTLQKENVIRKLAEECDEEEEQENEEDEDDDDEDDEDADERTIHEVEDDEKESDDGFASDDEHGFANTDSEGEDSENEWWTPAAASTAATSAEHIDPFNKILPRAELQYGSSMASNSSANMSLRSHKHSRPRAHRTHSKSSAMQIDRPATPDLPDSTDFVCGTLDEDRPKEQAYINAMKEREAAKHPLIPQDIDPTFPTSDPDMDEEDDEDLEDAVSSAEEIMHGSLDSIHGTARRVSPTPRRDSIKKRSPVRPQALRMKSPAPKARVRSPPPPVRHRSPAPAMRGKSPAPKPRARSPAPLARAKSPAPKKLFGRSPRRLQSPPAHSAHTNSPPNTRRVSPSTLRPITHSGLAGRPNTLAITASLPKHPGGFLLSRLGMLTSPDESSDTVGPDTQARGGRRRGAIDIVKGLEKKKQRRHEKLCQKMAAKAAARGEERKKIKPGRGCERMREVGLELQKYKGGAGTHIISY